MSHISVFKFLKSGQYALKNALGDQDSVAHGRKLGNGEGRKETLRKVRIGDVRVRDGGMVASDRDEVMVELSWASAWLARVG